jgi:hypothetical protein
VFGGKLVWGIKNLKEIFFKTIFLGVSLAPPEATWHPYKLLIVHVIGKPCNPYIYSGKNGELSWFK